MREKGTRMKTQYGICPIEECRSVKVTGTGIENDCCRTVSFEKKSENGKIDQKESSETVQGAKRKAFVKKE